MKATSAVLLAAAGASLTSATPTPQAYSNITQSTETTYQCPGPDGNFCVGETLTTLLTCTNGIAQPAVDCCDQTANQPPLGSQDVSCYQTSAVAGDAACTKSCVVYPLSGNSYPVPGDCTPAEAEPAAAPMASMASTNNTSDAAPAEAPPSYSSAEAPPAEASAPPSYSSAEATPAEASAPPSYSSEAPPAEASATSSSPPMKPMLANIPFKFPGPMFNMTMIPSIMPPAMPSTPVQTSSESEAPPTPPSMPIPAIMPPTETAPPSAPAPEVSSTPPVEVSSPPAPEVLVQPSIMTTSAPPAPPVLEIPSATLAVPVSPPVLDIHSAPPAAPAMSSPPAPLAIPAASTPAAAPPAMPNSSALPPASPLPFWSHLLGSFVPPPATSLPLPTTDTFATTTIPFQSLTQTYASPSSEAPGPAYTYSTSADFSLLPKATLPAYITTVTVGTTTQYHTVFSDCGNGTMVFGSSTIALPTGSAPNEVPVWSVSDGASLPPLPTITTVPCSLASGWNNTALYTPTSTSALYSYIATLPASATATPKGIFTQGDGYDHTGDANSMKKISGGLLAGLLCGIAAMAL